MGQDQTAGRVRVLCWVAAPVVHVLCKPPELGNNVKNVQKVQFENTVLFIEIP